MFVCIEMKKYRIVIKAPSGGRKILPHCTQDSSMLGVTVCSHGYMYCGCWYLHLSTVLVKKQCSCKGQKSYDSLHPTTDHWVWLDPAVFPSTWIHTIPSY